MARKFQIGDTVEVVKVVGAIGLPSNFKRGHRGKIIRYVVGGGYCYVVQRKNGSEEYFKPQELKLIRKGIK